MTKVRVAPPSSTIAINEEKPNTYFQANAAEEEEQHLLSQLRNAQSEIQRFSELDRFIQGVQLGARLMLDTFLIPQQNVVRDIDREYILSKW